MKHWWGQWCDMSGGRNPCTAQVENRLYVTREWGRDSV